jgi:hypothetical protein
VKYEILKMGEDPGPKSSHTYCSGPLQTPKYSLSGLLLQTKAPNKMYSGRKMGRMGFAKYVLCGIEVNSHNRSRKLYYPHFTDNNLKELK